MLNNSILREIAETLEMGMIVWVNPKTGEHYALPDPLRDFDYDEDLWQDTIDEVEAKQDQLVRLTGMDTHEAFRIMEDFAETVGDAHLQQRLFDALNRSKPFRHFKDIVDDAGPYRQKWFDFREAKWVEWTRHALEDAARGSD